MYVCMGVHTWEYVRVYVNVCACMSACVCMRCAWGQWKVSRNFWGYVPSSTMGSGFQTQVTLFVLQALLPTEPFRWPRVKRHIHNFSFSPEMPLVFVFLSTFRSWQCVLSKVTEDLPTVLPTSFGALSTGSFMSTPLPTVSPRQPVEAFPIVCFEFLSNTTVTLFTSHCDCLFFLKKKCQYPLASHNKQFKNTRSHPSFKF